MDVSHPIRSAIPTVDGPVLETLSGTTAPLSLSDVHRINGQASISGVRNALLRLTKQGLVDRVPGGYVLNREHLAAPAILELAAMRRRLFERINQHITTWNDEPPLVGLFGSAARRDGDAESDIDLLVVADHHTVTDHDTNDHVAELATAVQQWTGNDCHIVVVNTTDLSRMSETEEPILAEWNNDIVVISGDLDVLGGHR